MLVFLTSLHLIEFQVRYLALFLLFSVKGGFRWFWMGNLHKNIQLMLEFFRTPFLVLHFSFCTLMTLLMLTVMLLSMLMIILSTLSVIRHLICDNNLNWLLSLNLIYETLWTGAGSGVLISMLKKCNQICLISLITLAFDVKMDDSFTMLGLTFSSKLDWCSYIIYIAKTASKKI